MKEGKQILIHSIIGFSMGIILSYTLLSLPFVNNESSWTLPAFNFLFVSLTFPLNGALVKKVFLLITGDFVCLLWNYLISLLAHTFVYSFGDIFNTLYMIFTPLLNLFMIVSFWSVSLTVLARGRGKVGVGI
ncbi:MAG TPA: hypothetical protein VIH48_02460 [Candidatus Bathyarchaeia archaeon]